MAALPAWQYRGWQDHLARHPLASDGRTHHLLLYLIQLVWQLGSKDKPPAAEDIAPWLRPDAFAPPKVKTQEEKDRGHGQLILDIMRDRKNRSSQE